jgi:hypothetical protein
MLKKITHKIFSSIVLAILTVLVMTGFGLISSASASSCGGHCEDLYAGCWTFGWDFTAGTILSVINMVLAVVLLTAYIGTYKKSRAQFNLVLILVAFTLLSFSFVANPLVSAVLGYEATGLGPFFILPDLFALMALSALLYLRLKY